MILLFSNSEKRAFRLSQEVVQLNTQIDITEEKRQDAILEKNSVTVFFLDEELKNLQKERIQKMEQLKMITIKN